MSEPARPDPIVALREPGFLIYLLGTLTSNIGSQMRLVAIGWEIYNRTGRKSDLGYVGLVFAVPVLLLALPSGMAADRYPRRSIIMLAQTGLAISGCGLAWVSHAQAPLLWIYLWLFSTGVFRAFGWPASQAIVTGLVPTKIFSNAATWRSVAFQLAWAIGSLCGGVLVARWTPNYIYLVYLIDAASCIVLIVCMAIVKPRPHMRQTETRSWHSLAEGVHFVRRQPLILSTITLDMVAVLFGGATALLPVYAKDILGVGATGFGWLRAMQPLGAIFMSLRARHAAADRSWGHHSVVGRGRVRPGDDCVRPVNFVPVVARGVVRDGGGRQHFRRHSFDRRAIAHARFDAWPRGGRQYDLHRHQQ